MCFQQINMFFKGITNGFATVLAMSYADTVGIPPIGTGSRLSLAVGLQ